MMIAVKFSSIELINTHIIVAIQRMFIVEHYLASLSYLNCRNVFRDTFSISAVPEIDSISSGECSSSSCFSVKECQELGCVTSIIPYFLLEAMPSVLATVSRGGGSLPRRVNKPQRETDFSPLPG